MNNKKYHVNTKFTYIFTESIEQLFKCFLSYDILSKIDSNEYPYQLNVDDSKGYSLEWKHPSKFHMTVQYGERIDGCNFKSLTKKITSINHKKVDSLISLKYSFYVNITNQSTFLIIDIESEKNDNKDT